jgi:hypothetical protein
MNARYRRQLESAYAELKWREYSQDPELFFRECIQIPAGETLGSTNGRAFFDLFDYQSETLDFVRNNRYVIVLKARQLGLTTLMMAYAFWMLFFRPGSNIVMVSRSQTAADKALEIVDFMHSFLPDWVKDRGPSPEGDAAKYHSYRFSDGLVSSITSYAATRTVAAGQTATLVLWDEAALAEYQEDALRTLLPTTDAGGSMVVFSTARGGHNTFARIYREAEQGLSSFKTIFHPWFKSRFMNSLAEKNEIEYTNYEAKKRTMSSEPWRFFAEYPASSEEAFRQSGRSRFPNLPDIEQFEPFPLRGDITIEDYSEINFENSDDGLLHMTYEALDGPPDGCKPIVTIDPSSGTGGDYTVITAGWLNHDGIPERVAYWRSNMVEPADYAQKAFLLGRYFSDSAGREALMVVERQGGYGDTVIHVLRHMGYKNLYVHRYSGHRKYRQDTSYGFPMTASRRPMVVDSLAAWLDFENGFIMEGIDPELRRELGAFVVREDGKVAADVGMHDDIVMSTALFVYVANENAPKATEVTIDEPLGDTFTVSVNHIFEEAEKIRRFENRESRKTFRRERRQLAWR